MIPLLEPHLAGNERAYVDECFRTNQVSSVGPFVERFESEFAAYVGSDHAVAVSSGTAALHLAMRVLGVTSGDEVFVPTFSFVASVNPVLYQGASPVFVDSESRTWNVCPERIVTELNRRARVGEKQPRAVEVAHILGHPADLAGILEACDHYGIPVIEDAAESLGATWTRGRLAGRQVGTVGRVGCYSFNGNKVITTGGGGMLVTDDPALASEARHLSRQARIPGAEYVHDCVGYNYRMTNLAAAVGCAQLECLPDFLLLKRVNAAFYDARLADHAPRATWADPSFWLYSVLTDVRAIPGVETRPLWTPIHTMAPYAQYRRLGGAEAETIHARGLSLPSSVGLTTAQQEIVVASVKKSLTRVAA